MLENPLMLFELLVVSYRLAEEQMLICNDINIYQNNKETISHCQVFYIWGISDCVFGSFKAFFGSFKM